MRSSGQSDFFEKQQAVRVCLTVQSFRGGRQLQLEPARGAAAKQHQMRMTCEGCGR